VNRIKHLFIKASHSFYINCMNAWLEMNRFRNLAAGMGAPMSSLALLKHHADVRGVSKGGESISGLKADKMRHDLQGGSTTSPGAQASHGDTKHGEKFSTGTPTSSSASSTHASDCDNSETRLKNASIRGTDPKTGTFVKINTRNQRAKAVYDSPSQQADHPRQGRRFLFQ